MSAPVRGCSEGRQQGRRRELPDADSLGRRRELPAHGLRRPTMFGQERRELPGRTYLRTPTSASPNRRKFRMLDLRPLERNKN